MSNSNFETQVMKHEFDTSQDTIWGEEVKMADAEDYLSADESASLLNVLLNAGD